MIKENLLELPCEIVPCKLLYPVLEHVAYDKRDEQRNGEIAVFCWKAKAIPVAKIIANPAAML
jgi:hypothetical protein